MRPVYILMQTPVPITLPAAVQVRRIVLVPVGGGLSSATTGDKVRVPTHDKHELAVIQLQ